MGVSGFGGLFKRLTKELPRQAKCRPVPQKDMAALIGVKPPTITDWLKDTHIPKPDAVRAFVGKFRAWDRFRCPGTMWPADLRDEFDRTAQELLKVSAAWHTAGYKDFERLETLSEYAYQDASVVAVDASQVEGHVALEDLYVRRAVEGSVLKRALAAQGGSAQLVVGEPGCGKTSLLWSLFGQLSDMEGVRPLFVRASYLIEGLTEARSETGLSVGDLVKAVSCAQQLEGRPVVLVDTLDLLVAHPRGTEALQALLRAMDRLEIAVILTCRPEEAVELQFPPRPEGTDDEAEEEAEAVAFRRPQIMLGLYTKEECREAVRRHADVFCPAARYGPSAAGRLEADILDAVYQGLPVREVCGNPLYLRLLFDLYAPDPPLAQIDAAGLFEQVRIRRVLKDSRAGDTEQSGRAGWDLSDTARALARYLLSSNNIEYRPREAGDALERLLALPRERIDAELAELRHRGLLADAPAGGLRFFHQTFFEFMAAEYLRHAGRGKELVARMTKHPTDLVLAAVAGQLIPRADPGTDSVLLRPLLEHPDLSDRALEWYADMRGPAEDDIAAAHAALRRASRVGVQRFLERLPGHVHKESGRWVEDLTVVWPLTEERPALRRVLFATVGRLASQHPEDTVRFCAEQQRLAWWVERGPAELKTHKLEWIALFAALFPHAPESSLEWVTQVCRVLITVESYKVVADAVEQVEACVLRLPPVQQASRRQKALRVFETLLNERPEKTRGTVTEFEQAVGILWEGVQSATEEDVAALLAAILEDGDRGAGRARLHGAARLAAVLGEERACTAVAELESVRSPRVQTAVVLHVLVPVLLGRDTPLRRALADACRTALSTLPGPSKEPDGSRTVASLMAEAVRTALDKGLPLERLSELLPDDSRPELWLARAGLVNLVGPASAGGHAPAMSAVSTWIQATEAARDKAGWSPDVARKVLAHLTEDILAELVEEALRKESPAELSAVVDAAGERHLVPSPQVVEPLRRYLTRLDSPEEIALWNALITHWSWAPPTPDDVANALALGDQTYPALLRLVNTCVHHPDWRWPQLKALLDQLTGDCETRPHRQAGAVAPHDALAALLAHRHPLTPADTPTVVDTVLDLTLPDTGMLSAIDRATARLAAHLLGRLATPYPEEAARGLVTAAQRLGSRPNGVSADFAHFTEETVGLTLAHLPAGARHDFVFDLARAEENLGKQAVTAFSMLAGTTAQPPDWYRQLSNDKTLPATVRSTVTSHLHRYARTRCGGPWPALMTGPALGSVVK
ncbi:NACHT domain-containing protein [Streptomyces cellulosae]